MPALAAWLPKGTEEFLASLSLERELFWRRAESWCDLHCSENLPRTLTSLVAKSCHSCVTLPRVWAVLPSAFFYMFLYIDPDLAVSDSHMHLPSIPSTRV